MVFREGGVMRKEFSAQHYHWLAFQRTDISFLKKEKLLFSNDTNFLKVMALIVALTAFLPMKIISCIRHSSHLRFGGRQAAMEDDNIWNPSQCVF